MRTFSLRELAHLACDKRPSGSLSKPVWSSNHFKSHAIQHKNAIILGVSHIWDNLCPGPLLLKISEDHILGLNTTGFYSLIINETRSSKLIGIWGRKGQEIKKCKLHNVDTAVNRCLGHPKL